MGHQGLGETNLAGLRGERVHLTAAGNGSRVAGWQRVGSYLADGPACSHHRALGWDKCPMAHIFTTCPEFYRTLSDLPHATRGDPEDADSGGEDHLPDAARYLLINLGGGPQFPIDDTPPASLLEANGIEVMEHAGLFGRRPSDVDALFEREEGSGTTQRSLFALGSVRFVPELIARRATSHGLKMNGT